jgi:hypothetical protein
LLFAPQSPQPSQTASSMTTRVVRTSCLPRLRSRRGLVRALLVVDDDRHARHLAQLALHLVEVVAVPDGHAGGQALDALVPLRLVRDDDRLHDALGGELAGQRRHGQRALGVLRAVMATAEL